MTEPMRTRLIFWVLGVLFTAKGGGSMKKR